MKIQDHRKGITTAIDAGDSLAPTLEQLLGDVEGTRIERGATEPVRSIVYDSREAGPGSLFVALRGAYVDGHGYLQPALERGATACLVDRDPRSVDIRGYQAVAVVHNTRQALSTISRNFYGDPSRDIDLIGITGTDGKTTTSFMTEHLIKSAGLTTGLISTVAIHVADQPVRSAGRQTTPESLDTQRLLAEMRDASVDAVVLETSSHGLETHRVDDCHFDIGVVTNITHEHIDFHGSIDAYRRAKRRLLDLVEAAKSCGGRGTAIVNMDDPGARSVIRDEDALDLIGYGTLAPERCRVSATRIEPVDGGYAFDLHIDEETVAVVLPMFGIWNVSNSLAAAAASRVLDIPLELIAAGIRTMPAVPGRMQPVIAGQPFNVIVDYAHTAPALETVLKSVRESTTGTVMVLFGSGGERDIEKRADMGAVAARFADYFIVTSEDPRFEDPDAIIDQIARGAIGTGAVEGVDFDRQEDRSTAIERILSRARDGDTVILAGKGHEQSMIYGSESRPWDEASVALDTLENLGYSKP